MVKSFLKKILPNKLQAWLIHIRNLHITRFHTKSYAIQGEDLILRELFEYAKSGFYVDVGAHHPFRFSNTYLFYKVGWRGLNIDAMPNSMKLFNRFRPRDINIECGVAFNGGGGSMIYYSFNEPALNGFSPILKTKYDNHPLYHLIDEISVPVRSLESILDEYLPQETYIDFLSVDVEGLDLEVLKSNNWDKYRPKVVVIECWDSDLKNIKYTDIYTFLTAHNYKLFAKTIYTLFFRSE